MTLHTVALCKRLRDALHLEREVRGLDGVDVRLLITRTRAVPLFLGALAFDVLRLGPSGWRRLAPMIARRRLRIFLVPLSHPRALAFLRALEPDVGLHATPIIYRRNILECFRLGILNAHIGLLPRYRGRSVMEWSILNGDPTGITTFFIDEGIDTGPEIVLRKEISVKGPRNSAEAKEHLFSLAGPMYAQALLTLQQPDYSPDYQSASDGTRWYVMSQLMTGVVDAILAADPQHVPTAADPLPLRETLIAEALRRRLADLGTTHSQSRADTDPSDNAEEDLRVLMVRFWPRVSAGTASAEELGGFFDQLSTLREAAQGDDIRFLDAFNCAYEAIRTRRWSDSELRERAATFQADYRALLERRLGRVPAPKP